MVKDSTTYVKEYTKSDKGSMGSGTWYRTSVSLSQSQGMNRQIE